MGYKEQYLLSEYQELGVLDEDKNIHIVRNRQNGLICVKKTVPLENKDIYFFLKNHPSHYMPCIYECLETEDSLTVIEEYITGDHLENMVKKNVFSKRKALQIIEELGYALIPLHHAEPPIICRDLKAENVMLTDKGEIKLIDFDIARQYKKGLRKDTSLMGTEGYAAPEQYGYKQTDCRTDIYALGVLLNYLILHCFPIEKQVDGPIGTIVEKCIEMDPNNRYQTVEELIDAVKKLENKSKGNYKLPGFRTGNLWKMILAVLGYIFITYVCLSLEVEKDGVQLTGGILWLERSFMWFAHIIFILTVFDYFHINDRIVLLKSNNWIFKSLGYIVSYFVLNIIAVSICIILEMIFF